MEVVNASLSNASLSNASPAAVVFPWRPLSPLLLLLAGLTSVAVSLEAYDNLKVRVYACGDVSVRLITYYLLFYNNI